MRNFGKIFSDNVSSYSKRRSLIKGHAIRGWGARITILYAMLLVFFCLLFIRLFHLTIIRGSENRNLSENNRVKTVVIHAPRGIFYDRSGAALSENVAAIRVTGPCKENTACPTRLIAQSQWNKNQLLDSVYLEKDFIREYTYPYETAHLLGFLGEISEAEIKNPLYTYQDYLISDRMGRVGLEAVLEKELRGIDGKELIEIDSQNNRIRTLGKVDAIAGHDITLSIDINLQKKAFEALGEASGAVVVSKPNTGEILAFVSTPSFDPNKLHSGISDNEYSQLFESSEKPLFNRALSGVYPPGSTFKIVSALAGLESKSISAATVFEDTGIIRIGEFSFSNWYFTQYGGTEGNVDIVKALARSNDIFFYRLGEATGIDEIAKWGKKLGVGTRTGIELFGEAEGVMPDREYQQKVRGTPWYLGDSYHIAIGQGDLQTTPLQVNRFTNVIASGGKLCNFTLFKITGKNTNEKNCTDLEIKPETIALVTEGMRRACYRGDDVPYQGTGYPFFDFSVMHERIDATGGSGEIRKIPVACKTGTAEFGDPEKTHAWFTAFAPLPADSSAGVSTKVEALAKAGMPNQSGEGVILGDPEIVVTVLVEKGGEGSSVAAPIAKQIMEEWFKR